MRRSPTVVRTTPSQEGGAAASGGGPPGSLVYNEGATGLTYGTISGTTDRDLTFTQQQDGAAYMVRAVHSGPDVAYYEIIEFEKNGTIYAVNPPHNFADGDFVVGGDEPEPSAASDLRLRYRNLYKDGTEAAMTVVLHDAAQGTELETISATATFEDPFVGALQAEATLKNGYSAQDLAVAAVSAGNPVFEDIIGSAGDMNAFGSGHSVVASGPSPLGSLSKSWQSTARSTSDYIYDASDSGGNVVQGGIIIFRWTAASFLGANVNNRVELMACKAPNTQTALIQVNGQNVEEAHGTNPNPVDSAGTGVAHDEDTAWYAYAFFNTGSTMTGYLTKLEPGFTWKNKGSGTHGDGYWGAAPWQGTRCRAGYLTNGTVTGTLQVAHMSLYETGINEAKLQAIVETIIV